MSENNQFFISIYLFLFLLVKFDINYLIVCMAPLQGLVQCLPYRWAINVKAPSIAPSSKDQIPPLSIPLVTSTIQV